MFLAGLVGHFLEQSGHPIPFSFFRGDFGMHFSQFFIGELQGWDNYLVNHFFPNEVPDALITGQLFCLGNQEIESRLHDHLNHI